VTISRRACARLEFPADSAATFGPDRFRPSRGGLESVGPVLGAYRTLVRPPATSQFDPERSSGLDLALVPKRCSEANDMNQWLRICRPIVAFRTLQ
jgi:hypothetical protein